MLTVSESLCHPWGTLNIPGGLSETESAMTVSVCKCGETGGLTRSPVFSVVLNVVPAVGKQHLSRYQTTSTETDISTCACAG